MNGSETCNVLPLLYWKEVPAEGPDTSSRLEGAALFRGSGKAVMRTGFEDRNDLQLMVQCQSPQHGHSQAEVGSFILNALGERLIDDPGCAGGSAELRPGAWGSYVWGCSAGSHNLVLIDGVAGGTHSFGTIKKNPHGRSRLEKQDHLDFLERMKEATGTPPFFAFGADEPSVEGLFFTLLYPVRHGGQTPRAVASHTPEVVSVTIDGGDVVAFNRTDGMVQAGDVTTDATVFHTRVEDERMVHWLASGVKSWRSSQAGIAAAESVTLSFQGVTGWLMAPRQAPLTISYPGIQGIELKRHPGARRRVARP